MGMRSGEFLPEGTMFQQNKYGQFRWDIYESPASRHGSIYQI